MIERLLENWLDNADERGLQVAFQQMLVNKGHRILHSTRHAPIEHGKDVIAIDSSGVPCAYQLKSVGGKKLKKSELSAMYAQLDELTNARIEHPSLKTELWHKSFLVLNGELDEEASDLLTKKNAGWEQRGHPENRVFTIVRGELFDWAKDMSEKLLPKELTLFKLLLELYLEAGDGMLPKDKFAEMMMGSLPLAENGARKPSIKECKRAVTSTALINAIAVSSFTRKCNHFAEIESWMIYLAHVFAVAEKHNLETGVWQDSVKVIEQRLYYLLSSLVNELRTHPSGLQGDPLTDQPFYRARVTLLCALVSAFSLWERLDSSELETNEISEFCRTYVTENRSNIHLWGEAAIPQILNLHWFLKCIDATPGPDWMLAQVLEALCTRNHPKSSHGLPSPYYDAETTILSSLRISRDRIEEAFVGSSFTAEALLHLFVRSNWKQHTKLLWPDFTRLMVNTVEFDQPWRSYMWRVEDQGLNLSSWPDRTKNWETLKEEANESAGSGVPTLLKEYPHLFLLFLIVYPHRCNSESVRWLDTFIKNNAI